MKLYHGTTEAVLRKALAGGGLRPRGKNGTDNWQHTVTSNARAVYLTSGYPLHFALNASKDSESGAILEIDTDRLNESLLCADEDVVEQAMRNHDDLPKTWDMKRRTLFYRRRIRSYSWESSLRAMGTCAYTGRIPVRAIRRAVVLTDRAMIQLVVSYGIDPMICLMNYRLCGDRYNAQTGWLFDGGPFPGTYGEEETPRPDGLSLEVYK